MTRGGGRHPAVRVVRACAAVCAAAVCTVVVLLVSACSDTGPILPKSPAGGGFDVSGRVTACGSPLLAQISAIATMDDHRGDMVYECRSDASGSYSMPLAPGRYLLRASVDTGLLRGMAGYYAAGGLALAPAQADTLTVRGDGTETKADFRFGALHLRLHFPSTPVIDRVTLTVVPWRDAMAGRTWGSASSEIPVGSSLADVADLPIPPGTWAIRVQNASLGERIWLPGTWNAAEAESIVVTENLSVDREYFLDSGVSVLRGSVVGSWQTIGSSSPRISAFTDDSTDVSDLTAGSDGTFRMPFYSVRRVRLRVSIGSSTRWFGADSWAGATVFALTPGQETVVPPVVESGLLVRLEGEGASQVYDPILTFVDDAGQAPAPARCSKIGDAFPVSNLLPGTYRIHIRPAYAGYEGWVAQWFDGASDLASSTPVVVPGGGVLVSLAVTLNPGGELSGHAFRDPPGTMDYGSSVFVTPADADSLWGCSGISAIDGTFHLRGLPPGAYKIGAAAEESGNPSCGSSFTPSENPHVTWFGGASWASATVVTIEGHETVDGIEIQLP